MKIRYGQLGLGFGRNVHIPAFLRDDRFELVSICSQSPEKAETLANSLGVTHYTTDPNEIMSKVDALAIALPPMEQEKWLPVAIKKGLHIFCEKLSGCKIPLSYKEKGSQALVVNYEFLEIDVWRRLYELIQKGRLGTLSHIEVKWSVETYAVANKKEHWKTSVQEKGGVLNEFASHVLYYLEYFVGPIEELCIQAYSEKNRAEEVVHLILKSMSGVYISASISTNTYMGSGHSIELTGSKGSARLYNPIGSTISDFELEYFDKNGKFEHLKSNWLKKDNVDDRINAVASLVTKFADWIEFGNVCEANVQKAKRVDLLLDVCRKSLQEKKICKVNPLRED